MAESPLLLAHEFFRRGKSKAEGWSQLIGKGLVHVWSYPLLCVGSPYVLYRNRYTDTRR